MKSKQKTTQTQTQTRTVPDTPDIQQYRAYTQQGADFTSPLSAAYGQAERAVQDQVFESDLPEAVKERIKLSQLFNLAQEKGAALSAARMQEHAFRGQNLANLAGLTRGENLYGVGTTIGTARMPILPSLIQGAGTAAGAFLA